jgi:hypothetical protein
MAASEGPASRRIEDEQLQELLGLLEHADSAELKLTVPDEDLRSTAEALGLDPLDAVIRQVYFFDTPDLALDAAGLVVRGRRTQGKPDDSVVKRRPVVPDELPGEVRDSKRFGVEVDALPGGFVCSGSFKGEAEAGAVRDVAAGRRAISELFSKKQRAFYSGHAPEGVSLDDLAVLGPINVLKLKMTPKGYDRRLVTELWLYPDGSRIFELSTKCEPGEAFQVAAEVRAFLAAHEVNLYGEQQTKTRTALEYFSRLLRD